MSASPPAFECAGVEKLSCRSRRRVLALVLGLGVLLALWHLGTTGLIDETPPLFAAAARGMAETGDWLTPRVNGLPRYDKPPLIYWLMGVSYALPGHGVWDPLGSWAARLPSGLSCIAVMLGLADTLLRWPQADDQRPQWTAVAAPLAFALSPLVLIWSRTAVSDALLCALLSLSLLLQWRRFAEPDGQPWWAAWVVLGFAVLAKGPVAVVLSGITLLAFGLLCRELGLLWTRLRPLPGLFITAAISLPWYAAELLVEGQPFWDSFFGYHNLQRFTSVVNNHLQPWWYFIPLMLIAALPFTPLLLLGLMQCRSGGSIPKHSLQQFAACWLFAVLLLFTTAATKLPSYWLPATPAAALLIALSVRRRSRGVTIASAGTVLLIGGLSLGFWMSGQWIPLIDDPEMPTLAADLSSSGLVLRAAGWFTVAALVGGLMLRWSPVQRLVAMQLPLVLFHVTALVPIAELADRLRQRPVRDVAAQIIDQQRPDEPVAMVGVMKPSLHFYTNQVVLFEGRSDGALVNLADRLRHDNRRGWKGRPIGPSPAESTVLIAIDRVTSEKPYWQNLSPEVLGNYGIYQLWRLDRSRLQRRADALVDDGVTLDWREPRPERY